MEIRPRSAGEILDDAWLLVFADAPLLLALSGLFTVPLAVVLLLLLTSPTESPMQVTLAMPALFAVLLPLTGLGSGACQALFRRRVEGRPVALGGCLAESLRRSPSHICVRTLTATLALLGTLVLVLPFIGVVGGGPLFSFSFELDLASFFRLLFVLGTLTALCGLSACAGNTMSHPFAAGGTDSWWVVWTGALSQTRRQAGKVALVTLCRPLLLLFACLNGLTLATIGLWVADHFGGFDVALAAHVLTPANPVWVVSVGLLAWLLLVPYFEASNYLLHADDRARYEGLDLWYRVRRLFPASAKGLTRVALLGLGLLALAASPAWADQRRDAVQDARKEIARITQEVRDARDYANGRPWLSDLRRVAERLDQESSAQPGRFRWFEDALTAFARANQQEALHILAELDRRLDLIAESLPAEDGSGPALTKEQLRALLPTARDEKAVPSRPETKQEPPKEEEPVRSDPPPRSFDRPARQGPGLIAPQSSEGFGPAGWALLVVLFLAVLFVAWRFRDSSSAPVPAKTTTKPAAAELSLETLLSQPNRTVESLWKEADDLAKAGKFLDAVRTLYLTVLTLLHRGNLIRCAPMRTNGEYVTQLRSRDELYRPFRGLTGMFEVKWYGERACQPADYDSCRRLAETIREGARTA
jgi:hypothetical protein